MVTRIEKSDLARDALYDKVNAMIDEVNTKIDNKDSLPSQTGNTGKFLTTDGTNASWGEVKQIEIKQDLTNPSTDTVPSTKAVSDESSRIVSIMNNKVNKSGDTMTGSLIINGNIPAYILQDSTLDLSQNFTDNKFDSFLLERDKNGKDGSFITFRHDTTGSNIAEIMASNGIDENRKLFGMGIWCRKNGEHGTYAPQCIYDNSIITTVSHGNNWIRFGNGLQICWGAGNNGQWNFPVPFKDDNYGLTMSTQTRHGGEIWISELGLVNKTNTGFYKADSPKTNPFTWTAIGYWY